jgi:hypothetical protein
MRCCRNAGQFMRRTRTKWRTFKFCHQLISTKAQRIASREQDDCYVRRLH